MIPRETQVNQVFLASWDYLDQRYAWEVLSDNILWLIFCNVKLNDPLIKCSTPYTTHCAPAITSVTILQKKKRRKLFLAHASSGDLVVVLGGPRRPWTEGHPGAKGAPGCDGKQHNLKIWPIKCVNTWIPWPILVNLAWVLWLISK